MAKNANGLRKDVLVPLVDTIRELVADQSKDDNLIVEEIGTELERVGLPAYERKIWTLEVETKSVDEISLEAARDWIESALRYHFDGESCVFGNQEFDDSIEVLSLISRDEE